MSYIWLGVALLSLVIWIILLCFWGKFWLADQRLDIESAELKNWPSVYAIIPARNEASLLPVTLRSLFNQSYPGLFKIILVDDNSTDNTAKVAQNLAQELDKIAELNIVCGEPLPVGWTGKLWAIEQGIRYAETQTAKPDYFLLTDADIVHDSFNLRQLVTKAQQENLDLVSLMVLLRCESFWEKFLIPAFIFFFQKLYPFAWVNNPQNSTAAAAGGCILIRRQTLTEVGGIEVVRQALIDDCSLAKAVKSKGKIWLGLTELTQSLRPYSSLASIWEMVARTAFTQLNYSPLLLAGTLIGMFLVYIMPPIGFIVGGVMGNWLLAMIGLFTWLLMAIAYFPTLKLYKRSLLWSFSLPAIAFLYTLMTLDSAWRHWRGRGGAWKGRVYPVTINTQP